MGYRRKSETENAAIALQDKKIRKTYHSHSQRSKALHSK